MKAYYLKLFCLLICVNVSGQVPYQAPSTRLLNEPVDVSGDFRDFSNTYYLADSLAAFNPKTGIGEVVYKRYEYVTRMAFNNMLGVLRPVASNEFPPTEYAQNPTLPFYLDFVSPNTVRLRAFSSKNSKSEKSLMLVNGEPSVDNSWQYTKVENGHKYTNEFGSVIISVAPWKVSFYDKAGKLLTETNHNEDNALTTYTPVLPFSFVRKSSDYSRSFSAVFSLSPGEKIFGCGESYTQFNKRGQKVVLCTDDGNGVQNETMYKPIPFFMSSKGYGVFMHTSSPVTCDFGKYFNGVSSLMIGDDQLDLFVFLGKPKDILDGYTDLTGKAQMPPLWSFGFWMSRITYFSEDEGYAVADKLRVYKIPCDVIHFDTGWFETDWRCDYKFSQSRFKNPEKMIKELKDNGFHISLWQLPYFTPKNAYFKELLEKGLVVKNKRGDIPYEDAVLDFSNPETVTWYQNKIKGLLEMGVGAIKVDFGEAAPYDGIYHSGKTGFYEHNLYPLRYNKTVADITKEVNNENIIWARSTWAGSQRYPVHWGGDPANTNTAMASTLRGGLSIGLSGFSFWSHDIGGFVLKTPENIYRRWTPFGMLTSHVRSHGAPPTEPWEYSDSFLNDFREAANLRYQLMPYIYSQAKQCTETGLPMLRALFVEFPDDPGSWLVDNQYLFGSDIMVAPLFEESHGRDVYLPPGEWIDYQTGKIFGSGWHYIDAGKIPVIMLVRAGCAIPHIKLAQSTKYMDWSQIQLKVFSGSKNTVNSILYLPETNGIKKLNLVNKDGEFKLTENPYGNSVIFSIKLQ